MVTSQRSFLSILICLCLFSCKTNQEKSLEVLNYGKYYQGSAQSLNALTKAIELDSTNAEAWRELSIPYLKRGMPHLWKPYLDKAVELDPVTWQGYRGYNYLWFYRDYKKAIADFDATDTLTPDFIDAPQGHSVDYWRGIAYLGLKNYDRSLFYFDKYIAKEIEESGEDWVELTAFLYKGIAHFDLKEYNKALESFDKQLFHGRNLSADAKYYKALIYKIQGELDLAKASVSSAIEDYNKGYYNNRPYVETLRQIYPEDLEALKASLE